MVLTDARPSTFAGLVSDRSWRAWLPASILARLPQAMLLLSWVVVGDARTGSLTLGATLTGVGCIAACIIAPLRGRLLDRQDLRRAVQLECLLTASNLALLIVVITDRWPVWTLFAVAVAQGWANAGIQSGLRALLVAVVPAEQLHRAHFVESLMQELCYVIGPIVVGVFILVGGVKVTLCVAIGIAGSAALALQRVTSLRQTPLPRVRLYRRRDIRRLTALVAVITAGLDLLESNVPQRMSQYHLSTGAAGWFMAVGAASSCAGGLIVSFRPLTSRGNHLRPAALLVGFAALNVPGVLAPSAWVYGLSLLFSTLAFVPLIGFVAAEFEARLTEGERGEGFAYMFAGIMGGGSLGFLATGLLTQSVGAREMPLLSVGLFLCTAIVLVVPALVGRRQLGRDRGRGGQVARTAVEDGVA
jgi:MFS family permease